MLPFQRVRVPSLLMPRPPLHSRMGNLAGLLAVVAVGDGQGRALLDLNDV